MVEAPARPLCVFASLGVFFEKGKRKCSEVPVSQRSSVRERDPRVLRSTASAVPGLGWGWAGCGYPGHARVEHNRCPLFSNKLVQIGMIGI